VLVEQHQVTMEVIQYFQLSQQLAVVAQVDQIQQTQVLVVLQVALVEVELKERHCPHLKDQHQVEQVIHLLYHPLKVILEEAQQALIKLELEAVVVLEQREHLQLHPLHLIQQE
tara:strand:+ start:175 stop:516 length:342 start_codon:yes stop_codon:yes gene_type:complete